MGEIVPLGADELGTGYLALPESGNGPGVVVCHSWWGRTDFFQDLCDMLAEEGFVALAPDQYDGIVATTIPDAERLMKALPDEVWTTRLPAAVDYLVNHVGVENGAVATLGCSLGGFHAFWLAEQMPERVRAVVAFYGASDVDFSKLRAAAQGHFVENDEYEPDEYVKPMWEAIAAAGLDHELHWYPGQKHWFFEPNRPEEYDPDAAMLAFQRTIDFLNRHLRAS